MKTTLRIPRVLQEYCNGNLEIEVDGKTIGGMLDEIQRKYPRLYECICDETGKVRRHIHLFLDNELLIGPDAFETRVQSGNVVSVFQAVSGG